MEKLNISLAMVNTSTSWGGLEMNTVRLADWLSQWIDITLYCGEHSMIAKDALKCGLKVEYVRKASKSFPFRQAWRLQKKIKQQACKQVLFTDNKDMAYCTCAKLFSGKAFKLHYQQHMQIGVNKKDLIHTLRYKRLDTWISPLRYLAEEVKEKTRISASKIQCIPLGVDTEALLKQTVNKADARRFFNVKTEWPLLGIIGRLDPQKGQHLLVEAVQSLKEKGVNISLLIVGEATKDSRDNYEDVLKNLVNTYHLEDRVFFRPFTNQIAAFYQAIDLFVLATNNETYGMVTIESMLFGTPVLATHAGGSREIVEDGAYGTLFEPKNIKDLCEKITCILNNPDTVSRQAVLAKEYIIRDFDYKTECKQLINLIKEKE